MLACTTVELMVVVVALVPAVDVLASTIVELIVVVVELIVVVEVLVVVVEVLVPAVDMLACTIVELIVVVQVLNTGSHALRETSVPILDRDSRRPKAFRNKGNRAYVTRSVSLNRLVLTLLPNLDVV